MGNGVSRNALFVCFGCLSNVGTLTGLAGLEVVRQVGTAQAGIFCLGGLATEAKLVLDKTRAAERIITVDGCPLNCARKIVEGAGFTPDLAMNLVEDCGLKKGPPLEYSDADMEIAVQAIREALQLAEQCSAPERSLPVTATGSLSGGCWGPIHPLPHRRKREPRRAAARLHHHTGHGLHR